MRRRDIRFQRLAHRFAGADVKRQNPCDTACGGYLCRRFMGIIEAATAMNHDIETVLGKTHGDGAPNAAARTGDQNRFFFTHGQLRTPLPAAYKH